MRVRSLWLCAALTAACSNDDWVFRAKADAAADRVVTDASDATAEPDVSDATASDATDVADATDVTDVTDATDATDVADATDATDAAIGDVGDVPMVDAPDVPMVDAPDAPTVDAPDVPMVDAPDVPTVDMPDVPMVDMPDVVMIDTPDVPTIDVVDASVDRPDVVVVDAPDVVDVATDRPDVPDTTCPPGFADCDPRTGCETDIRGDLANCGACGRECVLPNAMPTCTAGRCAVLSCSSGYGDCDGDPSNGCEATFRNDNNHCGACGNACVATNCLAGHCVRSRRVFVTSMVFQANLGGLTGADARCQSAADAALLGGRWRAWLSDGTGSPNTRFVRSPDPYVLLDGTVLASSYTALTAGSFLSAQLNRDEFNRPAARRTGIRCGAAGSGHVWSTTTDRGDFASFTAGDPNLACNNWSVSSSPSGSPFSGQVATMDRVAVDPVCAGEDCASALPLFCFEQ